MPNPERPPDRSVVEVPTQAEIPPEIEQGMGVAPVPTQFNNNVSDDSGKPLTQTPATQAVSIQIPGSNYSQLKRLSKGKIVDSITWAALWGIRMIKKAIFFGWNYIFKNGS